MQNSHQWITIILDTLFTAEGRRLQKNIDQLHESNQELSKKHAEGFIFQGTFYRHSLSAAGAGTYSTLHLKLWPDMQVHLRDQEQVELDKQKIRQVLFRLIEPCHCLQHVRDAIPDCIVDTLPAEVSALDRMGGPNFQTLRDLRQYNLVLPKIEFYSAARLLY